ncbi:glutamine synthetase [Jannaschia sp. Os4]|uniref:glutamine synthetase n=1 Tax=Jannaschia sp. Os4 TaxID=2807617 RepID=UPI00193A112F|nr:glutamine synthetase [Jannaschia sp. Os4]MBM2576708.1 glutamine synthetase [Jannaschia sp. Os4]
MSRLDRLGLAPARSAAEDLLDRAARYETLRLVFPDLHGVLRGKAVPAARLRDVLAGGIGAPATLLLKDTSGRTAFPVWDAPGPDNPSPLRGAGDLLMVPDPDGLVPCRDGEAWLFCSTHRPDGTTLDFAPTAILDRALAALETEGLSLTIGLELEFHVFARGPDGLAALHPGGQLLHDATYGANAAVLDRIRAACAHAGLPLTSLEVEMGASQFEATFAPAPARAAARHAAVFRALLRDALPGHHVTFMCRPPAPATMASGWHLHQSVAGIDMQGGWLGGLLGHAASACLLTNPTVNAYRRFGPGTLAPDRIAWGRDDRGAMVRAVDGRLENRVCEAGANPWLAIAAQAVAGLDGHRRALAPPPAAEAAYRADAPRLPRSLGEALDAFRADPLWAEAIGVEAVRVLDAVAEAAWTCFLSTPGDWDAREYLDLL